MVWTWRARGVKLVRKIVMRQRSCAKSTGRIKYERGLEEFIQFAQCNANNSGQDEAKIWCLSVNFLNGRILDVKMIREHLLCDGFLRSYTAWTWHGELLNLPVFP